VERRVIKCEREKSKIENAGVIEAQNDEQGERN
jgi:hypothetical protein